MQRGSKPNPWKITHTLPSFRPKRIEYEISVTTKKVQCGMRFICLIFLFWVHKKGKRGYIFIWVSYRGKHNFIGGSWSPLILVCSIIQTCLPYMTILILLVSTSRNSSYAKRTVSSFRRVCTNQTVQTMRSPIMKYEIYNEEKNTNTFSF